MEENKTLWQIAQHFRNQVVVALQGASAQERLQLRGDYFFVIDQEPSFLVMVDAEHVLSFDLRTNEDAVCQAFEDPLVVYSKTQIEVMSSYARTTISTTSSTLQRLLSGAMKAKVAYISGQVKILGDLPVFLKMISLLKNKGITHPSLQIRN